MKRGKLLLRIGVFAILMLLVSALLYLWIIEMDISIDLGFVQHNKTSHSTLLLQEGREMLALATTEYRRKSVFPYDFIPEDTDFRPLFAALFRQEKLAPEEERLVAIYRLCARMGIDLSEENDRFVLISARLRAGFPLEEALRLRLWDNDPKRIGITLSDAAILDIEIVDDQFDDYPYPDIEANPEEWKEIAFFVQQELRTIARKEGLLIEAEKRGKAALKKLFQGLGYERIEFRTKSENVEALD